MSSQSDISVKLKLTAEGIREATSDSEKLNQSLERGQTISKRPQAVSAGYKAAATTMENVDYGVARGAVGTGAGARDFAKESQGLGGLVHVYATFAANLFAVSAAYSALSKAMDTANLVKGLDQLGAASGRSLSTLAKQMVNVADGAISMKDAMTATALATSGGMTNASILQMTDVAKKASQALGRDMSDSLDRLTKGIVKIQPELLDELGIMTRVIPAQEAYALKIGKTAATLSDFEKRQAFANAVLEEGTKKFGQIDVPANPYSKLLASMTNVAQTGLELINTVLTPIVGILASSPTALSGVFLLIGSTLLKQAIPALTSWRENLVKTAESTAANAKRMYDSYRDYSIAKELEAEAQKVGPIQTAMGQKMVAAQELLTQTLSGKSKILAQAMTGTADPAAMDRLLTTEISRRQTLLDKLNATKAADTSADAAKLDAYNKEAVKAQQKIINLETTRELYKDIGKSAKEVLEIQGSTEGKTGGIGEWFRKVNAERAQGRATSSAILSQVGQDTQTKGMGDAFKSLFDNVKNGLGVLDEGTGKIVRMTEGLTGIRAITTKVSGAFIIMGSAIGTALSAISPYLQLFALLVGIVSALDGAVSKAAKQQEEFNSKLDDNKAAVKTVADTFDLYTHKRKDAFSTDGIVAFSASLTGVSDALSAQVLALAKVRESSNMWDDIKEGVKSITPFLRSNTQELKKSLAEDVVSISKTLEISSKKSENVNLLADILKIDPKDINNLDVVKKSLSGLTSGEAIVKARELSDAISQIAKAEAYTANAVKAFSESLKEVDKVTEQIIATTQFTQLEGKLGVDLVGAAGKFAQALRDPLKAMESIAEIGKDPMMLGNISEASAKLAMQGSILAKNVNDAQTALTKAQERKAAGPDTINYKGMLKASDVYAAQQAFAREVPEAEAKLAKVKAEAEDFAKNVAPKLLADMYAAGFQKISIALKNAKEMAQIGVERTGLSIAASSGVAVADQEYKLKLREISLQEQLIKASYLTAETTNKNTEAVTRLTAVQSVSSGNAMLAEVEKIKADDKRRGTTTATAQQEATATSLVKSGQATLDMLDAVEAKRKNKSTEGMSKDALTAADQKIQSDKIPKLQLDQALGQTRAARDSALMERNSKVLGEQLAKTTAIKDINVENKTSEQKTLQNNMQLLGIYSESLALKDKNLSLDIEKLNKDNEIAAINKEITNIQQGTQAKTEAGLDRIKILQDQINARNAKSTSDRGIIEEKFTSDQIAGEAAIAKIKADIATRNKASDAEIQNAKYTNMETELSMKVALGQLTQQDAAAERARIDLAKEKVDYDTKSLAIQKELEALKERQDKIDQAKKAGVDVSQAQALLDAQKASVEGSKIALDASDAAKVKVIKNTEQMSSKMVGFSQVVEGAFVKMGDALAEFAKTGKLDFQSLVDSMIADLLRLEMQNQMKKMYADLGGLSGIAGAFTGMFKGASTPDSRAGMGSGVADPLDFSAKGNAFDYGVKAFAKGGTFTNSIVDSPTLFKFARGTGLMGEAGPEAIMPLKRDNQGNLGIRGGESNSGNVEVNVHNYGTEKAETKESTDARGNRRIDVIIGEVSAGDMTRSGSSTQKALGGTYGLRPQLIRR
jgi:lambda family phage tail tape measure protein